MAFALGKTATTYSTLESWYEIGEARPHHTPRGARQRPVRNTRDASLTGPPVPQGNCGSHTPRPWSAPKCTTIPVFGYAGCGEAWTGGESVQRCGGRGLSDPRYAEVTGGFHSPRSKRAAESDATRLPGTLGLACRPPQPPLLAHEPPTGGRAAWDRDTRTRVKARRGWGGAGGSAGAAAWDESDGPQTDHLGRSLGGEAPARTVAPSQLRWKARQLRRVRQEELLSGINWADTKIFVKAETVWKAGLGAPAPRADAMCIGAMCVC